MSIKRIGPFLSVMTALGCVSVDPRADYDRAARLISEATGRDHVYRPGDEKVIAGKIKEFFSDGLTPDEAVQISLLNNPDLQAAFFEIGMARADLVQSGLLSNPSLSALVRFPIDGGRPNFEGQLAQNIIELWHVPVKKRMAKRQLNRKILKISHDVSILAARVKSACLLCLASEQALAVETENLSIIQELLDLTLARQQAGAATEVDVNVIRSELLNQEIVARATRLEMNESKLKLATLLGINMPPEGLLLNGELPDIPDWAISRERILEIAKAFRLDIQAAREEVKAAEENISRQKRFFLREVGLGVALESEGRDVAIGPSLDLEIPIFDQNQAQIAKAEFQYQRALNLLESLTVSVAQDVFRVYERFSAARDIAQTYKQSLLPLRRENLDLALESFRFKKISFLSVLEAQKTFLTARREYITQLKELSLTLPDLEAVTGQPLRKILTGQTDIRKESP